MTSVHQTANLTGYFIGGPKDRTAMPIAEAHPTIFFPVPEPFPTFNPEAPELPADWFPKKLAYHRVSGPLDPLRPVIVYRYSERRLWNVYPTWDEGDDWPEAYGTPLQIEADSPEEAKEIARGQTPPPGPHWWTAEDSSKPWV